MANDTSSDKKPTVQPFVRPGEKLGYKRRLEEAGIWKDGPMPGSSGARRVDDNKRPSVGPYLIIPAYTGDLGKITRSTEQSHHSMGVQILDSQGNLVTHPV